MSDIQAAIPLPAKAQTPGIRTLWNSLANGLFGSRTNTICTLVTVALVFLALPPFLRWSVLDATVHGTAADCTARGGACWAFIGEKLRFILFGFYPSDLHWRPALVTMLLLTLVSASALPRFWRRELLFAWPATIAFCLVLMNGGNLFGPRVPSNQWGGLPITLLVWTVCFAIATPLAILLALARRSTMGGLRSVAIAYIETMRATPMVAILYVAMLLLPMALPDGLVLEKTYRAAVMITLFWAAYIAEVVRGGLQTIPPGQYEAATALGIGYWRSMQLVILPQALRVVIPGMVNLAIGFLLATSLLAVIGIFDLLNAAKAAATDPQWLGFYDEAYLFVAAVYFALCFAGSRYSRWLEKLLNRSARV